MKQQICKPISFKKYYMYIDLRIYDLSLLASLFNFKYLAQTNVFA